MSQFLPKEVFMQILSYEEQIMNGKFSRHVVETLINLYAQCVEFYDSNHDPIQFYFLEKMQIILSHENTLKEMMQTPPSRPKLERVIDKNGPVTTTDLKIGKQQIGKRGEQQQQYQQQYQQEQVDEFSDDEDEEDNNREQHSFNQSQHLPVENTLSMMEMKQKYKQSGRTQARYSISKKRLERSKKVGMFLQIHQEQQTGGKSDSLFQTFIDKNEIQASTVKQNLNLQQVDLERRLQRRKTIKEGQVDISNIILQNSNNQNKHVV